MHRMTPTHLSREECIRRADEQEWLGIHAPTREGAARGFAQARFWRSQALLARPAAEIEAAGNRGKAP